MTYNRKNEMQIDVQTNYADEERLKLEEYVSENKHILEPKDPNAEQAIPGKK